MNHTTDKKLLIKLLLIQTGFISFILGLFLFSTAINKEEMAKQITYQIQSQLKNAPSREIPEALSAAQMENFSATGYFDEFGHRVFTLPSSLNPSYFSKRNLWDVITKGLIEIKVYFDNEQKNLAGTLRFVYPRFSFIPYALGFWIFSILASILLFRHYKKIWRSSLENEEAKKQNALISQIVNQVNHDLKSPIQTLFAVVDDSKDLTDRDKNSIYSAIERIKGITGDLKSFLKDNHYSEMIKSDKGDNEPGILHFASSLKQLCEEKRIAYKEYDIDLEFSVESEVLSMAVNISESDFLRVCSNLLRNSFEALDTKFSGKSGGKIKVTIKKSGENIQISFFDNGVGIPEDHYNKLKQEGFTFGKVNGTGLGLYYVFQKVEKWKGKIALESKLEEWTQFDLLIPYDKSIKIYENQLNFSKYDEVLILDDDKSVYERWSRKLQDFNGKVNYINNPDQIDSHIDSIILGKCLALVDQEIRGSSQSGLSVIREKNILNNAVLVTNNYAAKYLYLNAKNTGIKMIPKPIIEEIEVLYLNNF
ncbi:MAG: HAMP domain-containing histidine kinase [Bdellovibrionales bacterium]|nr:HAMP domain-containing histidine kinase [Bdellovibrionales bacterium]